MTTLATATTSSPAAAGKSSDYESAWSCNGQARFLWYCDRKDPPAGPLDPDEDGEEKAQPVPTPAAEEPKDYRKITTAKELREEVERLKERAIMEPTEANVRTFLEAQQYSADKSALFSDVARRVVWASPDLDYSLRSPVNNFALAKHKAILDEQKERTVKGLAKENGLIFFFRSDCQYCHAFAPTVKLLEQQYGMEVIPVSLDGIGIPEYPNPKRDIAAANRLGISTVPALVLGNRQTGQLTPIGFGILNMTEIINRMYTITATKPGEPY